MRNVLHRVAGMSVSALLILTRPAQAQEVKPPELIHFETAVRPQDASTDAVGVLLQLEIDEKGKVSRATVLESGGAAYDEAAVRAARSFEFAPATRDGTPVAVTLRYRYVFEASKSEAPPAPVAPVRRATPSAVARPTQMAPEAAAVAEDDEPSFGATAVVEAPPRQPLRRSEKAEQLSKVAGVRGDALRAVDIHPGIARNTSGDDSSAPVIRGASQIDSQVFLDGVPVPLLFHFGGITSFFQSRLLDRVELYPGNFSARYGRVSGGVVDARVKWQELDGLHAMVDLSVLDSAALVQAPLGKDASVALAARRSNIDFFFSAFVPEDAYSVVAAPVYWDYQALTQLRLGRDTRLTLMGYGSRDAIELVLSKPDESDPALRDTVGGALQFHHVMAALEGEFDAHVRHHSSLALGRQAIQFRLGPLVQELDAWALYGRSELALDASEELGLEMGLDFVGQLADGRYFGPRPSGFDNANVQESPGLARNILVDRGGFELIQPAFWAELSLRPVRRVLIAPGFRVDYFDNLDAVSVDPRLGVRLSVSDSTTLKGGVGSYSQPPIWYETVPEVGNPKLEPFRAIHFGAGVEQRIGSAVELGVEGFYKRIEDRVVGTQGGRPPFLENAGAGRIWGAEVSAKFAPSARTFAYLAYTLSRSERRDGDGAFYLFANDQTHVLSLVANQSLGAGWELGGRFRYTSGAPRTPVTGAVFDARLGLYRPSYGEPNSERDAAFHQLDVRIEKQWRISDLRLAAYLEVLNAYNATNAAGKRYSYDYSKSEEVSGLPVLPNLGLRGEL